MRARLAAACRRSSARERLAPGTARWFAALGATAVLLGLAATASAAVAAPDSPESESPAAGSPEPAEASRATASFEHDAGFMRAREPRAWVFPRDHGAHPAYATEWWYFTGILRDVQQGVFGYELTFFRTALRPDQPVGASAWRARDLILAHLAVTDVRRDRFASAEEVQRAAAGLAGADSTGLHVWAGDWSARSTPEGFRLRAASDGLAVELELSAEKNVVLHGEAGLSRKAADGRHASHYYSMPRLRSVGTVRSGSITHEVTGTTWMDHEFFTGDTPREGLGWDWFGLRLEDGRDLMLYVVRSPGEPGDAVRVHAEGTLVQRGGESRPLDTRGLQAAPTQTWTSPETAITYPVRWRLELPREAVRLEVVALLPQQEIPADRSVGFSYWEGACRFQGTAAGGAVAGEGYVELTGYERPGQPHR
jgi:predicted secreted hydrolase